MQRLYMIYGDKINRRTRWEPLAQPLVEKEETPINADG